MTIPLETLRELAHQAEPREDTWGENC